MPACVGDGVSTAAPVEVVLLDGAIVEELLSEDVEVMVAGFVVVLAVPPVVATQI